MATLKAYQVAAAALLGGFPPSEVPTAVAVARGESSFNTKASNSCCQGLWQIHRKAHASAIAAAGGVDALDDPVVNARLAYGIWKAAGGWCTSGRIGQCNPWQAYGTGGWKAKLQQGAQAYAEVQTRQQAGESLQSMVGSAGAQTAGFPVPPNPLEGALDAAGAIAGFAKSVVEFANRVGGWIADPQNWIRVAEVIGGGALILIGLRIAFHQQFMAVTKPIVKAVLPAGKLGKVGQVAKGAVT